MQCDKDRAAADAGANPSTCLDRRGVIRGLAAALAAAASMPTRAVVPSPYDETIFYLHRKFEQAADEMANEVDGNLQVQAFRRMTSYASALSLIPAKHPSAVLVKQSVAGWSWRDNGTTIHLPFEIVKALISSEDSF